MKKLINQTILRLLTVILITAGLFGGISRAFALSGSGTQADPYKISEEADWKSLCEVVNSSAGNDSPWAVLTTDITVNVSTADDLNWKMLGRPIQSGNTTTYFYFRGNFDGHGHTLTFNLIYNITGISTTLGQYIAPFSRVSGCTIKNLKVSGSISIPQNTMYGSDYQFKYAGGIVGFTGDKTVIQNCISNITIESQIIGDGYHGGIVGLVNTNATITIKDCLFNGKLSGMFTTKCGGLVGAGYSSTSKCKISNCLFAPERIMMSTEGAATISRCAGTISSCYYKQSFGATEGQGMNAFYTPTVVLVTGLNTGATSGDESWLMHCDNYYLKPFEHYVDITGWVSGFSANAPEIKGLYSTNSIIFAYYSDDGVTSLGYDPPTAPGHYRVSATVAPGYTADGDYWYGWNDYMKFCVVSAPTGATLTYNYNTQTLLTNGGSAAVGTFYYKLGADGEWSTSYPTATKAGDYKVYYYVKGDAYHNDIISDSYFVPVTIAPKTVNTETGNIKIEVPATVTYTGSALTPAVTVKDGDTVIDPSEYSVSYSTNNVNVTTDTPVTVTITDKTGGNYDVSGTTTFTIVKAEPTYTAPVAKDLYYNMNVQALITAGSTSHGTLEYGTDGTNFTTSTTGLVGTEAKDYLIYYRIIGDANHSDVGNVPNPPLTLTATIKPKPVSSPEILISPDVYNYDGTAKQPTVTVRDGGTVIPTSEYTVEYQDNVNAGSAKVVIKDNPKGNYDISGSASFTIIAQQPGVTPPTPISGLIYNAKQQNLIMVGTAVGGTMEYSLDGTNFSTAIPKGQDAKQYAVYYRVKGDDNHTDRDPVQIYVTISPKTVSAPAINLNPASFTYDGTEKKPAVTVKDGDTEIPASEYAVDYSNNVNVGTGSVVISDNTGGNYIVSGSMTFTILAAGSSVTPPVAKNALVYNGEAQVLVNAGSATGGTMYYGLSRSNYSTEVPTGKDAKTYTVFYKVVGDSNHADTEVGSVDVTIAPKTLSAPEIILTPSTFTYDGMAKEPSVMVKDGEAIVPAAEYTIEYSNNTAAGSGIVTLKDNEGGNYIVGGSATFTISGADPNVTPPTAKTGLIYNTQLQPLVTAGIVVGGTMEYSLDGTNYSVDVPQGKDAKQYEVFYRVKGDGNHGDKAKASLFVTISSKTVSTPTISLSSTSLVYDGAAKEPMVTVKDGEDVIPTSEYTVEYSNNVDVGTGMVIIMDKSGGNYIVNGSTTFQIISADAGITPPTPKADLVYTGSAQVLINEGKAEGGTMEYSLDRTNYSTEAPTGTDAKEYKVYYRVKGDANHGDETATSLSVIISPKVLSQAEIILDPANFIYDGTEKQPAVTVKDGDLKVPASEYTVKYSNNQKVGTGTVTLVDNDGGNYTVSGTANFAIISAVAGVTLPTAKADLVYNGAAQELITAGSAVGGTMEYSLDNKTYSTKVPTGTDAKQYNVYVRVIGDDGHDSMDPVSMIVKISSKTVSNPQMELSPVTNVYTGKEVTPTVILKDGDTGAVIPASEYTVSYSNNINIGTANIAIKDNPGGNYTVSLTTTFIIYDPNIGFQAPKPISGMVYNGKAQNLVIAGTATEGDLQYSLDGKTYSTTVPVGTNAATYTVWYRVLNPKGEVKLGPESFTVTISPKTVLISVSLTGLSTQSIPVLTVVDDQDNALMKDDYTVTYKTPQGKEVTPTNGQLPEGDYEIIVKPTGNYSGPSISTTFHVRGALSFVFTIQSDLVSVCLPFGRAVPAGYDVYYFDRVEDDGTPLFKRILLQQLKAGEPYILYYTGSSAGTRAWRQLDLSPSNPALVDLSTPIVQMMFGDYVFSGIYDDMTNQKGVAEGAYILQADNTWQATASSKQADASKVYLEAFHAYLRHRDRSTDSPTINVKMSPSTTAINGIILEDEDGEQTWYDLNGRRIDGPQRGVNILRMKSGQTRKVVIR